MPQWKWWFPPGMRKRWWAFRIIDLLLACVPRRRGAGLLVIRMDGIGDMVLFRPFLGQYAEAFGIERNRITVLGCTSWGALAGSLFAGYRVDTIAERLYERKFFYRLKVGWKLRRAGYDVVACDSFFRKTMLHDSLVLATGAPQTVVGVPYRSPQTEREFAWYLGRMTRRIDTGPHPTHELIRHQRFLEGVAGRALPAPRFTLSWPDRSPPLPPEGAYVVLNFGSNEPGRNWPLGNYLELAGRFIAEGLRAVFVGGPNERAAKERVGALPGGAIDLIGATSMAELLDLLKHAALVVTNETGPGHLALILGAPTVMIYGGGHAGSFMPYPERWQPAQARFVNAAMSCYHCLWLCDKRASDRDPFPCVAAVPVAEVWAAARDVLGRVAPAAVRS